MDQGNKFVSQSYSEVNPQLEESEIQVKLLREMSYFVKLQIDHSSRLVGIYLQIEGFMVGGVWQLIRRFIGAHSKPIRNQRYMHYSLKLL